MAQPWSKNSGLFLLGLLLLSLLALPVSAADGMTLFTLDDGQQAQKVNIKLEILAMMTVMSLLPAMLLMMTSFTRIIIVLVILRQALGLQQSPPNKVLIGIALVLSMFIMQPVGKEIYQKAYLPMIRGR